MFQRINKELEKEIIEAMRSRSELAFFDEASNLVQSLLREITGCIQSKWPQVNPSTKLCQVVGTDHVIVYHTQEPGVVVSAPPKLVLPVMSKFEMFLWNKLGLMTKRYYNRFLGHAKVYGVQVKRYYQTNKVGEISSTYITLEYIGVGTRYLGTSYAAQIMIGYCPQNDTLYLLK